jgi:hypothetical protein
MGCNIKITQGDGIFDQLTNDEIFQCVWMIAKENTKCKDIHLQCGLSIDMIIKSSLIRKTLDNVTCVMIAFENFYKILFETTTTKGSHKDIEKYPSDFISSPQHKKELISELSNKSLRQAPDITKKQSSFTKRVSLDVSNKKISQGVTYNMLSRIEKENLISKKKENDLSGMSKASLDNHPLTAKNISRVKDNNTIQQIRKMPSYGYFNDK